MRPVIPTDEGDVSEHAAVLNRLLQFVIPEPNSGCWLFMGGCAGDGYGRFNYRPASNYAHRAAFILLKGAIPPGHFVCHTCDTPCWINPDHLVAGTSRDNLRDMIAKGRAGFQRKPAVYRAAGRRLGAARGAENSSAKLAEDEAAMIIRLLKRGALQVDLARAFGVHVATIACIAQGRNWKHLQ